MKHKTTLKRIPGTFKKWALQLNKAPLRWKFKSLILSNDIYKNKYKNDKGITIIDGAPIIEWNKLKESINIKIYKTSNDIVDRKIDDLSSVLSTKLNLFCQKINCNYQYTEYKAFLEIKEDITVNKDTVFNEDYIKLNSSYKWNYKEENNANILIAGPSGSGKSYLLLYILTQLKSFNHNIILIDGKGGGLTRKAKLLNIEILDKNNCIESLKNIKKIIDNRLKQVEQGIHDFDTCWFVIDECRNFLLKFDRKEKENVINLLENITTQGREVNIFSIYSSQRITKDDIPGNIRHSLNKKILIGKNDAEDYNMAYNNTKIIPLKKGELYINDDNNLISKVIIPNITFTDLGD